MIKTNCAFCAKEIEKKPSAIEKYSIHFCNRKCHAGYNKAANPTVEKPCDNCGKPVEKTKNQIRGIKTGLWFCNNDCKNVFIAQNRRHVVGDSKSHRHKREAILDAANNACVVCKYSDDIRMLDVHHIDQNPTNNADNNLAVLCVWCHNAHHRGVKVLDL